MLTLVLWGSSEDVNTSVAQLGTDERASFAYLGEEIDYACEECNILMIAMTNVRRDAVGIFNPLRSEVTPNINRLAERSLIFEKMYSVASWTLPVSVSIFTSLYPLEHMVVKRDDSFVGGRTLDSLSTQETNVLDLIGEEGVQTAAFTGNFDYRQKFGATSAFEYFYLPRELDPEFNTPLEIENNASDFYGSIGESVDEFLEWHNLKGDQQWFAYIQGFDSHCEFEWPESNRAFVTTPASSHLDFANNCYWNFLPSDPIFLADGTKTYSLFSSTNREEVILTEQDIQHMRELYWGEVNLVDAHIGRALDMLEETGALENTIVMIYSEHGDLFGEHGRFMRGGPIRGTFHDEVLHVPFVLYHPKLADSYGGTRIGEITSLIDLAPTVTSLLGIDTPSEFRGYSLFDTIRGLVARPYALASSVFIPENFNFYFNEVSLAYAYYTHGYHAYGEMRLPVSQEDYTSVGVNEVGKPRSAFTAGLSFDRFIEEGFVKQSVRFAEDGASPETSLEEGTIVQEVLDIVRNFPFFELVNKG